MKPRILFVGNGRAGKDTAAEMLCEATGLTFAGTFSKYLTRFVAPVLGLSEEEAYRRRHESDEMRMTWFNVGNELRAGDPTRLARAAFANGDVSGGCRGLPEIRAIREQRVADLIVWVERDVPADPTLEYGREYADVVIENNGTLDELRRKVWALASLVNGRRLNPTSHNLIPQDVVADRLRLAYAFATQSPDPSTQNGAVLFSEGGAWIGHGWNRIVPECLSTPVALADRPTKLDLTTHAEQDAIFAAIRAGESPVGGTLYAAWLACDVCGKTIVGCGVTRVVRHKAAIHATRPDWAKSLAVADEMFRAAGIEVIEYEGVLGVTFRFGGVEVTA